MDRCLNLIPGSGILDEDHLGMKWRDCNSGLWAAVTLDTCQTMALNDKNRKKCLVLVFGFNLINLIEMLHWNTCMCLI